MVRKDLMKLDKFQEKKSKILKKMRVDCISNLFWCLLLVFILLNISYNEGISYWFTVILGIAMFLYNISFFFYPVQIVDLEFCKKRWEKGGEIDDIFWAEDKAGKRYKIANKHLFDSFSCGFTYSFIIHQDTVLELFDRRFIKKKSDI